MSLTWTQLAELAAAAVGCNVAYGVGLWCYWLTTSVRTLVRDSRLDPLTGLGTGHWLDSERWYAALRSGRPLGVVYLDVDHLKQRNDKYGHDAGDLYIQRAAEALGKSCRRGVDEVFRMYTAGDEFVILLHGELDPQKFVYSLRARLHERGVQASFCLAYTTETQYLPARTELRARAEAGCRQAKAQGGDRGLCILLPPPALPSAPVPVADEVTAPLALAEAIPELIADAVPMAAINAGLQARLIAESSMAPAGL